MTARESFRLWLAGGNHRPGTLTTGNPQPDQYQVVEVHGPLGRHDLQQVWSVDPFEGAKQTEAIADTVVEECRCAAQTDACAILYRLYGAAPSMATPMEYGGRYLEEDRRILAAAGDMPVIVDVLGEAEIYLDCISDLSFDAWTWRLTADNPQPESTQSLKPVPFLSPECFCEAIEVNA